MVLAWFLACMPKDAVVVTYPDAVVTELVVVAEKLDTREVSAVQGELPAELVEMLGSYNLRATPLPASTWGESFEGKRTVSSRLGWMLEREGSADAQVLVSVLPSFYSLLAGRYRWTVDVEVGLMRRGGEPMESRFSVPVFLDFDHERDDAAVAAATPVVVTKVRGIVEEWLGR